jgi:hypothetical protein
MIPLVILASLSAGLLAIRIMAERGRPRRIFARIRSGR